MLTIKQVQLTKALKALHAANAALRIAQHAANAAQKQYTAACVACGVNQNVII